MSPTSGTDRAEPTYEQARAELAEVVQRLEAGGTTLEESLSLWERGEELARVCQDWLDGARQRLRRAMEETGDAPNAAAEPDAADGSSPPF